MDHSKCIQVGWPDLLAHTHEGEKGWWVFPGEEEDQR
jgi:hypothetical protein